VLDDPDAIEPAGKIWVHWLVWNISPDRSTIPEDWQVSNAIEGENDFGGIGYGGPNPPDTTHTYRFKLFALDSKVAVERGATVEALGSAMDGHVLARTQIVGTYAP
jgi:Raf kinase inhibitor-like YbhB/YbcL family protein